MLIRAAPSAQRAAFCVRCGSHASDTVLANVRLRHAWTNLIRAEEDDAPSDGAVGLHALKDALAVVQHASSRRHLQRAVRL